MTSEFNFNNILIVGLGVMGGTFLKRLQGFNSNIYAIEIDVETQIKAKAENNNVEFITLANKDILKNIDLVIVTLYPNKVIAFLEELNDKISNDCLVVEISGIKRDIALQISTLSLNYNYLLVHPMAGRENGGYDYSDVTIYLNANHIIIDDVKQCSDELFEKYLEFIAAVGFNQPLLMGVNEHDQVITYTSQLTHIICVALLNSEDYQPNTRDAIGDSFRDLTRIAKLKVDLWSELFYNNKDNLTNTIDNLITQLESIKNDLNNQEALALQLEKAREIRIELEQKE